MKHFEILGLKVRDRISGYEGIAESVSYDLYGCIQIALRPQLSKNAEPGDYPDGRWFDYARLEIIDARPVLAPPDFATGNQDTGPADLPARE